MTAAIKAMRRVPRISATVSLLVNSISSVFQESSVVTTIAHASARKKNPLPIKTTNTFVTARASAVVSSIGCLFDNEWTLARTMITATTPTSTNANVGETSQARD